VAFLVRFESYKPDEIRCWALRVGREHFVKLNPYMAPVSSCNVRNPNSASSWQGIPILVTALVFPTYMITKPETFDISSILFYSVSVVAGVYLFSRLFFFSK
jgi:hypothetical protein